LKSPADKAAIRALQKPSTPAWAVNQLYWQRRRTYQQVLDAAKKVRDAHAQQLAGRFADVAGAERSQAEVFKRAADEVRELLRSVGEKETSATMNAVVETLQALPGRDDHGRLVKPLKPFGFEALAGLVPRGGATLARLAEARPMLAPTPSVARPQGGAPAPDKATALQARRREIAAQQKAVAAAERELRKAAVTEREARADQSRVEMTLARVQRERKELQARLDEITVRRDELTVEFDQRRKDLERASAERERLESRVRDLNK
jgi:septal ring factor EnvC (AmiA/AmiB activator)